MKKRGFTLIEMVIVITVLGLLMAFLIPKITEAQAKSRDIRRQSDITMIAAALVSYKHEKGEFPKANEGWMCVSELSDDLDGYLTTIPQDPSGKGLLETTQRRQGRNTVTLTGGCETGYSYTSTDGNFLLVYAVDDNKNGNYQSGGFWLNADIKTGIIMNFFSSATEFRNIFMEKLKQTTTGDYFVYVYK